MEAQIILSGTTPKQLVELINEGLKDHLDKLGSVQEKETDQLFTRNETCEFLKIDSSTLWAWTKKGKVNSYGIGNRVYYKKEELLECLTPIKQK